MQHYPYTKGQSLIETLVALGIIAIIVTAITSVVITSMGNTRFSKDKNLSLQYSQEGLEIIRQIRDSNYAYFSSIADGEYCLNKDSTSLSPSCSNANVDNFLRKVTIANSGCSTNITKVIVDVYWRDSKCSASNPFCHSSQLSTCLSTRNPVPTL